MTFLNMDAMSVASNCSIIYYTPQGGYFFFLNWRGVLWKSGGVNPLGGGSKNIPATWLDDKGLTMSVTAELNNQQSSLDILFTYYDSIAT